jgi:Tfp pilus assembly protein PilF
VEGQAAGAGLDAGVARDAVADAATSSVSAEAAEAGERGAAPGESDDGSLSDAEVNRLIARANYHRRHGGPEAAEESYRQALAARPTNARALAGLARLYLRHGRGAEARRLSSQLVEPQPSSPGAQVLHGDALRATGNRPGARAAWHRALRARPGYGPAKRRLGLR